MKYPTLLSVIIVLAASLNSHAENDLGKQRFEYLCAPCHGTGAGDDGSPMLPGTAALARRYQGKLPAALEDRTDLTADTLKYFVRNGIGAMPMFRKTELSDQDIELIADYLRQ